MPAEDAPVDVPAVLSEEEAAEAEPEKIAEPIRRSATESRCTRIRRRSDADDLPDDTGLTEKDLKEPTVHSDANGSSVRKMGGTAVRKSIPEGMTEAEYDEAMKEFAEFAKPSDEEIEEMLEAMAKRQQLEKKGISELMKERISRRK